MKKVLSLFLALLLLALCAACAPSRQAVGLTLSKNERALLSRTLPADEGLAAAKTAGAVVIENETFAAGEDRFLAFYEASERGEAASILIATYYSLTEEDRAHMSEELYGSEKGKYPMLFFSALEFDGKTFTITTRMSTEPKPESIRSFGYLMHYTGKMPEIAAHNYYDHWVLVDDPSVTWEAIEHQLFSSVLSENPIRWDLIKFGHLD